MARTSELPESGACVAEHRRGEGELPRISCIRPSLTWPKPWPPRSGGRCAAHSPRSLTCSLSGAIARSKPSWPSSSKTVSIGQISSRTNSRIQSSCSWNSGSVEKSHAIAQPPPQCLAVVSSQRLAGIIRNFRTARAVGRSMKPIAALVALLALALAATPAAAEERLAVEPAPFTADAYGDVIAWSSYDTVAKTLLAAAAARRPAHRAGRRALRRSRSTSTSARAPTARRSSSTPAPATSSSTTPRRASSSRSPRSTRAASSAARASTAARSASSAQVRRKAGRLPPQGRRHAPPAAPALQGDARGRRPRAERARPVRDLPHRHRPDLLHARDALPRRRRQAPARLLRRERRRELRPDRHPHRVPAQHLLRAHERGLRPGQQVLPLRPALAQAVRRAGHEPCAVTDLARRPLPDEPQLRRLPGPPNIDPTATTSCELLLTDPIRFTRASRADQRRTRP